MGVQKSDALAKILGIGKSLRARLGLGAFLVWTMLCLTVSLTPDPNPPVVCPEGGINDLETFRIVVSRVRGGESFYDATQDVFRARNYPTRSVFNWRTPFYAWFLGRVTGDQLGRWLLIVGVVLVILLWCRELLSDCGLVWGSVGGLLLVGSMGWAFGDKMFLFTELWAAMLIGLSLAAMRRGWTPVGILAGLAAVFYRELAVPYAVVACGLAAWRGRREAITWLVGLLVYVAFMTWHASIIHVRLTEADQMLAGGWVRFGGIRFLLATTQTNLFLMPLPLWVTALFLAGACLGLTSMKGEVGLLAGLTGLAYLGAYSVVGNPFNYYWGFIDAPLLALSVAYAPEALKGLVLRSFPRCLDTGNIEEAGRGPGASRCASGGGAGNAPGGEQAQESDTPQPRGVADQVN